MTNPAFYVDGEMERRIIDEMCGKKSPVRQVPNGDKVTIPVMAKKIATLMRLNTRYHPHIIITDREKRTETADQMRQEMAKCLVKEGFKEKDFIIAIADRCIENWILADWEEAFRKKNITPAPVKFTPADFGKDVIKQLLKENHGSYNEPTIGKELFLSCRPQKLYDNDDNFRYLVNELKAIPFSCRWLDDITL